MKQILFSLSTALVILHAPVHATSFEDFDKADSDKKRVDFCKSVSKDVEIVEQSFARFFRAYESRQVEQLETVRFGYSDSTSRSRHDDVYIIDKMVDCTYDKQFCVSAVEVFNEAKTASYVSDDKRPYTVRAKETFDKMTAHYKMWKNKVLVNYNRICG